MSHALRHPKTVDASAIHALVLATKVLDANSLYAYLTVCEHHAHTSVVAEEHGRLVGFVTGYRIPSRPDVLFVWQVGVHADARGRGLATAMLLWLVGRLGVQHIETNVTPSNAASRRLFQSLAERLGTRCEIGEGFGASLFVGTDHEPEELFKIGPLAGRVL